jgi:hypothetical protein
MFNIIKHYGFSVGFGFLVATETYQGTKNNLIEKAIRINVFFVIRIAHKRV